MERCGRNREGHLEVARLSRDCAATTCGSERESRELPGDMRIVAGHGVFETKDVPDIWGPARQLPEERPSLRRNIFTQLWLAHRPEQQPSTGYAGAVPRDCRGGHGDCAAHRLWVVLIHRLWSLFSTACMCTRANFACLAIVGEGRMTRTLTCRACVSVLLQQHANRLPGGGSEQPCRCTQLMRPLDYHPVSDRPIRLSFRSLLPY